MLQQTIQDLAQQACETLGFQLWGVELSGSQTTQLVVYINHTERQINVEDCAAVSNQLSALLDVHDPISEKFTLIVSSPGVYRKIFFPQQASAYLDFPIEVVLLLPLEGQGNRKKYNGKLTYSSLQEIKLQTEKVELTVPWSNVKKMTVDTLGELEAD